MTVWGAFEGDNLGCVQRAFGDLGNQLLRRQGGDSDEGRIRPERPRWERENARKNQGAIPIGCVTNTNKGSAM